MQGIAVLDAGGQYCHLLARRVREARVLSHVVPVDVQAEAIRGVQGIIISGGPRSVTEADAPRIDPSILSLGVPILGICYGHQLLAHTLSGGVVRRSSAREYGLAALRLARPNVNSIFTGVAPSSRVWMSHGDSVERPPTGFETLAMTDECAVAAMGDDSRRLYGVQFHPEVSQTQWGQTIIENFVWNVCGAELSWDPKSSVDAIKADIQLKVGSVRKVLFFVSGGVDSSVAYKLCADALGEDRLHGIYVNTGFMRKDESEAVMATYRSAGFVNIEMVDATTDFYDAVREDFDPEDKRKHIGATFLAVESRLLGRFAAGEWMLGQGTIYPDTIESGGTANSAHIKTHHNRVPEILERIQSGGGIVEPLAQFYKDEVREIGRSLGLPSQLVEKQPFPGPGLAVRYLCSQEPAEWRESEDLVCVAKSFGYDARALPLRAVGVQGDERTYSYVAVINGQYDAARVSDVSRAITNRVADVNRVAFWIGGKGDPEDFGVSRLAIGERGIALLQEADAIVRDELERFDRQRRIWQCPVVLLPLRKNGFCSIAIRPVESHDGMTAQYSKLPEDIQQSIKARVLALDGVDALLYDVTNKPPATIEWE